VPIEEAEESKINANEAEEPKNVVNNDWFHQTMESANESIHSMYLKRSLFLCLLRDTASINNPPPHRRSEWGSNLPPDCFVSRGSISPSEYFLTWVFKGRRY